VEAVMCRLFGHKRSGMPLGGGYCIRCGARMR